jgi:hypothetical protein
MVDTEYDVVTGVTLADALRNGIPLIRNQVTGWGDGVHDGCALTTAAKWMAEKGYR